MDEAVYIKEEYVTVEIKEECVEEENTFSTNEGETRDGDRLNTEKRNAKKAKFQCEDCEYSTNKSDHLKRHRGSVHNPIKYPCDQ